MRRDRTSRSIARQFARDYFLITVLPMFTLLVVVVAGFWLLARQSAELMREEAYELNATAEEYLQRLGERLIQNKARDVARQVEIYLRAHPGVTMEELQADEEFVHIAMQDVGETGYTCLYEAGTGIMRIHPNPDLIDVPLSTLRDELPTWWAIFEPSLTGEEVSGYYDWRERDGSIRRKYMTMTPVGVPLGDTTLMVAATTYIDEFSKPVLGLKDAADEIVQRYWELARRQGLLVGGMGIIALFVMLIGANLLGQGITRRYIRPIEWLSAMAEAFDPEKDITVTPVYEAILTRQDEIGLLARALYRVTSNLQELVQTLEEQVQERTATLARRSTQLEAAAQVARDAAATRDVKGLLDQTVRLISDRFGFYHAGIFLLDETKEYAVLRAASSEGGQRMLEQGHRLKVGEVGIVGWVARTGEPRISLDVGGDAVFFDNPDLPPTRSEMALPLRVRGKVIGVLDVQSKEAAAFTEEDVAILQTMADQIALAIENARLLEESHRSLQELERLYGVRTQEVWQRLTGIHRAAYHYTGVDVEPLPAPPPPTGKDDPRRLAVPIRLRGQTIGFIVLQRTEEQPPWSPDERRLAEEIGSQTALALENARLVAEMETRATRERVIGEMTARLTRSLDMDTLLDIAVQELAQMPGVAEVAVFVGNLEQEEAPFPKNQ